MDVKRLMGAVLLCVLLFSTGTAQELAPEEGLRLTVYTSHKEEVYRPVVEEFERRTGIWVRVVTGGTTELLERIEGEADDPRADVMFGGGVESLMAYEGCFAAWSTPRDMLLEDCRFDEHRFVAFSRLPLVIIYNPRLVDDPPQGWRDLLSPRWRGQIAFADPGVSGSSFTALATLMQALDGEASLALLADNVRGHVLSGSGEVVSAVASGAMSVGVTLHETAKKRILAGDRIEMIWPEDGTSAVPDGAAVIANCAHEENARLFVRFILGEDVQRRVQTDFARLSVRSDLARETEAEEHAFCAYDIDWASANQRDILAAWGALMREEAP